MGSHKWDISLTLRVVLIPLGVLIRLMPSKPFEHIFKHLGLLGRDKVLPTAKPDAEGWGGTSTMLCDNLGTFANICGGYLRSSSLFRACMCLSVNLSTMLNLQESLCYASQLSFQDLECD